MNKLLLLVILITTVSCAQTPDTMRTWQSGYDSCFAQINALVSPDADALVALFNNRFPKSVTTIHDTVRVTKHDTVYQIPRAIRMDYFSTMATPDTLSAWLSRGYLIEYFGTQSSTNKRITVRGLKPL